MAFSCHLAYNSTPPAADFRQNTHHILPTILGIVLYAFSLSLNAFAKDHAEKDFAKPNPAKSPLESSPTLSQPCQIPPKKPCQKSVLFHSLFATKSLSSPRNSLSIGVFTDFSKKSFADVYALGVYYAQPNTFFRINGRINLELEAFFPAFNQTSHPANTKSTLKTPNHLWRSARHHTSTL